jgi:hypothetical protein
LDSTHSVGRMKETLRERSKSLLGTQFRAEVAAFIATAEPPFWARAVARQLDIPETKVASELTRLSDAGLLAALPSAAWDRRKLYERRESELWDFGLELVNQAAAHEAARTGATQEAIAAAYWDDVLGPEFQS